MTLRLIFPLFLCFIGALFAAAPLAQAGTAGIHDNAGFFSANAKSDADWNIRDLQKTLKKDVCVETFSEIPAEMRQGVNLQNKASLNGVFETWAIKRAREQSVNGVYILLVKEPAHLHAIVGNETQKQAFTLADRDALVRTMLAKLRAKDYDAALREGVTFIASTMKNHAGSQARSVSTAGRVGEPASSSGGWLVPLLVLGVLAWLAFGLIRSLFRRGTGTAPGSVGAPMAGNGGGFGRSLLGGLFGAAAGMWMYDQFFGSHGSSAYGAPPSDQDRFGDGGSGDSPFGGAQDTDYSGSGGDFGAGSGGSDFGGGGGGDFGGGGGDSGGGGDF